MWLTQPQLLSLRCPLEVGAVYRDAILGTSEKHQSKMHCINTYSVEPWLCMLLVLLYLNRVQFSPIYSVSALKFKFSMRMLPRLIPWTLAQAVAVTEMKACPTVWLFFGVFRAVLG